MIAKLVHTGRPIVELLHGRDRRSSGVNHLLKNHTDGSVSEREICLDRLPPGGSGTLGWLRTAHIAQSANTSSKCEELLGQARDATIEESRTTSDLSIGLNPLESKENEAVISCSPSENTALGRLDSPL